MASILIVEDDHPLREGIAYALRGEGFEVTCAADAAQAAAASHDAFELILLDITLPDGNGFELCRKIRSESAVPIIFLTARDEETSVVMGLDGGADDYITKPFRIKELISRIRAVLRRREAGCEGGRYLVSELIRLDVREGRLLLDGEPLALTRQEYRLVLLFMSNPGRILTRDSLLARIWDEDGAFVDDNTLTVAIRRIREKLETDPAKPHLIETVRGIGYRWAAPVSRG